MATKKIKGGNNFSLPYAPHFSAWRPGYTAEDLEVFSYLPTLSIEPELGFIKNFIGVRSRTADMWDQARTADNTVQGPPIPHDFFEGSEWVAVMKAMLSTGDRCRMMELGAGWGPWVLNCARLCELLGISDYKVYGYEADPGRYELMLRHFEDNSIPPQKYAAIQAAIGAEAGSARWPKIYDPPNAGGARPVRGGGGEEEEADKLYMGDREWVDIRIDSMRDVLGKEAVWDLIHIDIQGWEWDVCRSSIASLNERAAWVMIGTHSRKIEGDLVGLFNANGWILENEEPCAFQWQPHTPALENMTIVDGIQAWRNPRVRAEWRRFVD